MDKRRKKVVFKVLQTLTTSCSVDHAVLSVPIRDIRGSSLFIGSGCTGLGNPWSKSVSCGHRPQDSDTGENETNAAIAVLAVVSVFGRPAVLGALDLAIRRALITLRPLWRVFDERMSQLQGTTQ